MSSQGAATNDSSKDESEAHHGTGHKPVENDVSICNEAPLVAINNNLPKNAISVTDNEVLVNEIVHGHKKGLSITTADKESMKVVIQIYLIWVLWSH